MLRLKVRTHPRLRNGRQLYFVINHRFSKFDSRSEEHTSELQSRQYLVCRLLLEKKKKEKKTKKKKRKKKEKETKRKKQKKKKKKQRTQEKTREEKTKEHNTTNVNINKYSPQSNEVSFDCIPSHNSK